MNIAFLPILLLLYLLPGIAFVYSYRKGNWQEKSPVEIGPVTNEITWGAIIAILLHFGFIFILKEFKCFNYSVDYDILFSILLGKYEVKNFGDCLENIRNHINQIVAYFVFSNIIAIFLARCCHRIVRFLHLDLRYDSFRFRNDWYYALSGELKAIEFYKNHCVTKIPLVGLFYVFKTRRMLRTLFVRAAAIVNHGGNKYIYFGVIESFFFKKDGSIDRLHFSQVRRRVLEHDKKLCDDSGQLLLRLNQDWTDDDSRFYNVDGDLLIIQYDDMVTLNLQYHVPVIPEGTEL